MVILYLSSYQLTNCIDILLCCFIWNHPKMLSFWMIIEREMHGGREMQYIFLSTDEPLCYQCQLYSCVCIIIDSWVCPTVCVHSWDALVIYKSLGCHMVHSWASLVICALRCVVKCCAQVWAEVNHALLKRLGPCLTAHVLCLQNGTNITTTKGQLLASAQWRSCDLWTNMPPNVKQQGGRLASFSFV